MGIIKSDITMKLPVKVKKSGDWFIASCPILDVSTQGKTKDKALSNLTEALTMFLVSCFERGTLDAVLKECGFKPLERGARASRPKWDMVDIPIPLMVSSRGVPACHA